MRTTIDMPDGLYRRAKVEMAKRGVTFRALVVDALEQSFRSEPQRFVLRDASAGYTPGTGKTVSSRRINETIDELREAGPSG